MNVIQKEEHLTGYDAMIHLTSRRAKKLLGNIFISMFIMILLLKVFTWVIVPTISMNIELGELRNEFSNIVTNSIPKVHYVRDGDMIVARLDYGGKLTKILQKRDEFLQKQNCDILFGGWYANKSFVPVRTFCIYRRE